MKTLPKYFVIKRDENNPLWYKLKKKLENIIDISEFEYAGFDGSLDYSGWNAWDNIYYFINKPEIITLEQWNECVNGEQRKIIRYKAPFDLFGGAIKKDTIYVAISSFEYKPVEFSCYVYNLPAEIVEKWEPVYEEKLEICRWFNESITSQINFKGRLTQEIVDKIKEVINE